jgi:hypothetical protein
MLMCGQKYGAALALSRYLVHVGDYPTGEAAADAIANGRVMGMPSGRDLSEVPF